MDDGLLLAKEKKSFVKQGFEVERKGPRRIGVAHPRVGEE